MEGSICTTFLATTSPEIRCVKSKSGNGLHENLSICRYVALFGVNRVGCIIVKKQSNIILSRREMEVMFFQCIYGGDFHYELADRARRQERERDIACHPLWFSNSKSSLYTVTSTFAHVGVPIPFSKWELFGDSSHALLVRFYVVVRHRNNDLHIIAECVLQVPSDSDLRRLGPARLLYDGPEFWTKIKIWSLLLLQGPTCGHAGIWRAVSGRTRSYSRRRPTGKHYKASSKSNRKTIRLRAHT